MKFNFFICHIVLGLSILILSCKKEEVPKKQVKNECTTNDTTVRLINEKRATIQSSNNQYYIVEEGTIDTRLQPCNLSNEFMINQLSVLISGEVKKTVQSNNAPCCIETFFITKISK